MLTKQVDDRFDAEALGEALRGESVPAVRRASTARTVAMPAPSPLYGSPSSGPQPAAALDRALEAGFEMLKQQRPKMDAGLDAGRRAIAEHAPKVRSIVGRAMDALGGAAAGAAAGAAKVPGRAVPMLARLASMRAHALANHRRTLALLGGVAVASTAMYWGTHFALHHRSRCPVAAATAGADSNGAAPKARGFTLMVDDAGAIRSGGDAEIYYDVCGLEKGASFTTRVTIAKSESGLDRLLGRAPAPVTQRYEESASGPAVRRHRSLDMDGMPGGSYWVNVTVTDEKGRHREEGASLRVRGE
jgi:hypothetical protein